MPRAPLLLLLLLITCPRAWATEADAPDARLATLRHEGAGLPVAELEASLRQLVEGGGEAGTEAAAWLGQLAQQAGRADEAHRWFARARAGPGPGRRLGLRGLGDLALGPSPSEAEVLYAAALVGADGVLAAELAEKRALAHRRATLRARAGAALGVLAIALTLIIALGRRGDGPAGVPVEPLYLAPILTLFTVAALGEEPGVAPAVAAFAAGALLVAGASGWAAVRRRPRGLGLAAHLTLLVTAEGALAYAALAWGGLLDRLAP